MKKSKLVKELEWLKHKDKMHWLKYAICSALLTGFPSLNKDFSNEEKKRFAFRCENANYSDLKILWKEITGIDWKEDKI